MDSPPHADSRVLGDDSERAGRDGAGRDLRDVLRSLVVVDSDAGAVSLSDVARAAASTDRFVPELLTALEDDATAVRVGAAWALCALADDQPGAVPFLARRLTDRVDGGPFEVGQVLAYLRGRYPGRVADAVDAAVETGGGVANPGDPAGVGQPDEPGGGCTGRDRGQRVETDGGVPAGAVADLGDGRRVVRPSRANGTPGVAPRGPAGAGLSPDAGRPSPSADPPRDHPTHPDFERSEKPATDEPATGESPTEGRSGPIPTDRPETPETFAAVGSLSSLDRLSAVDTGVEGRYATGYRCRAVDDGEERGVAVRLFDRPGDDGDGDGASGDRLAFRADLEECLARWEALGDLDGVVAVAEWGRRPRPWVRTDPVDASLADRGRPPVEAAVDRAVDLARAVADLHARGAVHGGVDPRNVVYPCDLDALERPVLDNVGLMSVFRRYFEPADYLDPRFAAPEYFDDDFGTVDTATDVYGLGAVVYYLLTGRPPFVGSYGEIRRGALEAEPPAPSEVAEGVPARLDPVVAKALAKPKIARYDAVDPFLRDLERVCDGD